MQMKREVPARLAPNLVFLKVLKKYFLVDQTSTPHFSTEEIKAKSPEELIKIARESSNPYVIKLLLKHQNPEVAKAAGENSYWKLIGKNKKLLKLSRQQRIEIAGREKLNKLLVFVLFERDLSVRRKLYLNPAISVHMLNSVRHYLIERGNHKEIERHLQVIYKAIEIRRRRIFQATEIFKHSNLKSSNDAICRILPYLLDSDDTVVTHAIKALRQFDASELRKVILQKNPLQEEVFNSNKIWLLLQRLKNQYFSEPDSGEPRSQTLPERINKLESLRQDIDRKKLGLLDYCSQNLPEVKNLVTLARAYLDEDDQIRKKLSSILNLEELLALVSDRTFPQPVAHQILQILKYYPDRKIQNHVSEILLEINERTRSRLREMEISIDAYFDIVFNSLGYPKIHQIQQAFKIIEAAKKLSSGFLGKDQEKTIDVYEVNNLFNRISQYYRSKVQQIYLDVSQERLNELENIYEMIVMVLNLPREYMQLQGFETYHPDSYSKRAFFRAKKIWRFSLGQYLGRLHELDEMIRRKWLYLIAEKQNKQTLKIEMQQVIANLEMDYKKEIQCNLKIECKVCTKRPCASERFLRQVEFFLGEFLDEMHFNPGDEERAKVVGVAAG